MTDAERAASYRTAIVHKALLHRHRGLVAQLCRIERHACDSRDPACRLELEAKRDRLSRLVEESGTSLLALA